MPAFLSKGCPPLVDVPDRILQQAATHAARARELSALSSDRCRRRAGRARLEKWRGGSPRRSRRRARAGETARHSLTAPVRHGHAVALRQAKHGRARGRQRPDERDLFARATSSSSSRSPSNPPSPFTTPSSIPRRTKRSGSITICRSRATSSASCFRRSRRRSTASRSAALTSRRARSAATISITSKWTTTGSASPLPMSRERACRHR